MAVSLLSVVLQNLNSLIQKEVGLLWGVDKEMKRLSSTLSTIQAVLEDADLKQMQNNAIQDWLRKLRDATYELDDILDACSTEALRWESEGQRSGYLKKVSTSLLYPFETIMFHHKIGNRMNEIKERLDEIADERTKFHFSEVVVDKKVELAQSREIESLLIQPKLTWFKMHDLVHDLAQSILGDECQIMEVDGPRRIANKSVRHVTLVDKYDFVRIFPDMIQLPVSLRTIQMHRSEGNTSHFMSKIFCDLTNLGSLRVLDARYHRMKAIPSSIGMMKHLRRLPKKMKYLRSLRHLCLSYCFRLIEMPPELERLNCLKTLTLFVVGKSRGCSLAELQSLNLGGELCIRHLERVRNPMDAKEANLVAKQNLRRLELFWEDNADFKSQENVEQLLESLEPHPNIKGLVIHNYKGLLFPLWMRESSLRNVVEIELWNCKNFSQLPPFGKLPLLKYLKISGMDKVKYIDDDFPGEGPVRGFPSLEVLNFDSLPNLEGLSREEGRELLPRLREMKICNCPNLRFPCLLSLIKLEVRGKCTSIVLTSISNLQSLNILRVVGNEETICFPIEVLRNLTLLDHCLSGSVLRLSFLPEEGLRGLESLQLLEIYNCKELSSLSEGLQHLTALEELSINQCPKLLSLPEGIKHLNSLQTCRIGMPGKNFVSLPEALQHVHSLQSLSINGCPELTSLPEWLGNLTLLRSLNISNCPKVSSIPASMQSLTKLQKLYNSQSSPELARVVRREREKIELTSLPEWLGNLTLLRSLDISNGPKVSSLPASIQSLTKLQKLYSSQYSPELARRCEKGKGEDWYKIAHVPEVSIFPL
ncbi:hypothetical protein Acr_25g0007550 [Actinidia rufa]|uniref:Rx N-terminal domain-containing protein n=1 Tax=Actinidia rufa TaxID=165716 RepID=A0A7J0GZX3_9ERIC|nr:hypothetical protein Acr_25g0007550 [Actinidia rufa]